MTSESTRPEWVHCVGYDHIARQRQTWCGRTLEPFEWMFMNPSHAAENGRQDGRLVACPACVEAITTALRNGADDISRAATPPEGQPCD